MRMDRKELKARGKAMLSGNLGMLIVCMVMVGAAECLIELFNYYVNMKIGSVLNILISGPLSLGVACVYLGMLRNGNADIAEMGKGFSRLGDSILLSLMVNFFTFLWVLLLIIPGIIASIRYSQAWYVMADHPEMGAKLALERSKELMDGHKMEYFVLCLSFLPWILLGIVTCGFGFLYVVPYMNATFAVYYNELKWGTQKEQFAQDMAMMNGMRE